MPRYQRPGKELNARKHSETSNKLVHAIMRIAGEPVRKFVRALFWLALRVLPSCNLVVVHGWPDSEENSLRIAGALAGNSRKCRVYLLADDPVRALDDMQTANFAARYETGLPSVVRKNSITGALLFVLARVVFYTHGLFGSPNPGARRVHVLLGHGHGPKSAHSSSRPSVFGSSLAVTGNSTWGYAVLGDQSVLDAERILLVGNPREDAFNEEPSEECRQRVRVAVGGPFVVWLPTYRLANSVNRVGWQDGAVLDELDLGHNLSMFLEAAHANGLQLVAKVHPLDAVGLSRFGVRVLTDEDLLGMGVNFYQFLNLSAGLITDYSSVWVDYLSSGRPIGLYCPDVRRFEASRGLNLPLFYEIASGLMLRDQLDIETFFSAASGNSRDRQQYQSDVADSIGHSGSYSRTLAVLGLVRENMGRRGLAPSWY